MPATRWTEWVSGVKVGTASQAFRARYRGRSNAIKWDWDFVDRQVGSLPCCPECGATVPKGRHQARHEHWHNQLGDLLEDIVRSVFGIDDTDEDAALQLESGGEEEQ